MSQDYRLGDTGFRSDVTDYARQMMRKGGDAFKRIIDQLDKKDYRFANPNGPISSPIYHIVDRIMEFRERQVFVPIALKAWLCGTSSLLKISPQEPSRIRSVAL